MINKELYLREAGMDDMDIIFAWANDETVRKNAFHTEAIPYEMHKKWYAGQMADKDSYLFILEASQEKIGQVRFKIEEGIATIDYSVASGQRKKGYGTRLIEQGMQKISMLRPDVKKYLAQVKYENSASAKVFEKCGFAGEKKENYIEFTKRRKEDKHEDSDCDN